MKFTIAPLAGLGLLAAATGAAVAAPPAYCALYAREYANQFAAAAGEKPGAEPKIQDEAYYRCLNLDQEPEMPSGSAYYGTSVDTAGQADAAKDPATAPLAPPAVATAGDTAAAPAPKIAPEPAKQTADSSPSGHSYTGGATPWTADWFAACRKYFPNSFNEKDGTILPNGSTKRVFCK